MGVLDFLRGPDINEGVSRFGDTPGSVLLDVRTREEYAGGHVPGSRNLPLQELAQAAGALARRDTPIFVYCLSGARSGQAVSLLRRMGYENVTNIGGISRFRGKVVTGV